MSQRRRASPRYVRSSGVFAGIATIGLSLGLAGCFASMPVNKTDVDERVPEQATTIVVGQTDRTAVRAQFGEPWLSSDEWQFDLFRSRGRDVSTPFMFVFWWPVPLGVAIDKTTAYVLVHYDELGIAEAEAHGLAVDPSFWANLDNPVAGGAATGAQLVADELCFGVYGDEAEQFISVDAEHGRSYLATHSYPDDCLLVTGFDDFGYGARVSLDDGPGIALPDREPTAQMGLLALRLKPGQHRLRMQPLRHVLKFDGAAEFACQAGEVRYATLGLTFVRIEKVFFSVMEPRIEVRPEWPEVFDSHRWLVWGNGQWLLPAKVRD